jgi:pyridoxamine 5'-phosphate oxidase
MTLDPTDLTDNPFDLFVRWYDEALAHDPESNAMALATVDPDGVPDVRMVLMRGLEHGPAHAGREAVVFYTNYESHKALALLANPACAALFYWGRLEANPSVAPVFRPARQVRIVGRAEKVDPAASDAYFAGRPRLSQLGAWASPQSQAIADRDDLLVRIAEVEARFAGGTPIPRPPFWGGFRIVAERVEVWQAQAGRLHDRFEYRRTNDGWNVARLAP